MEIITRYGTIYNVSKVKYYASGAIKSISLEEANVIAIVTKAGKLVARNILTFYETGELQTLEPAHGTRVKTFIGVVNAYKPPSCKDQKLEEGSLKLMKTGEVISLATVQTGITLIASDGTRRDIAPTNVQPLYLTFLRNSLEVIDSKGKKELISYKEYRVQNFTCNKVVNVMSM